MDLVLTQIATLSSQRDQKITALRQEVTDRYKKITDELTADAENLEKHLEAKLQVITSNLANQQEELSIVSTEVDRMGAYCGSIGSIDFYQMRLDLIKLISDFNIWTDKQNQIVANTSKTQELCNQNLERIRIRSNLYDNNFRIIYQTLTTYTPLEGLATVYMHIDDNTDTTGQS